MQAQLPGSGSYALHTDFYEFSMLSSFVRSGMADRAAVFEAFARKLPSGRRYGVVAGIGRLTAALRSLTFPAEYLEYLQRSGAIDAPTAAYLADFDLTDVTVDCYREGDLYFPGSPVVTVSGPLGKCVVLETLVLSILNYDCAVAAAASRMVQAAAGRSMIEMGSRRTHEQAALAAARAAYLVGFDATSNTAAGLTFGIPVRGTAAHAFTLAHSTERAAFQAQVAAHGKGTTLLVDTYDIEQGIRTAVDVAGPQLGGVRIDSGDLKEEAWKARELLDSLGATQTRIVVTSDLDEHVITDLVDAPIDGFGVGTRLVTGSGAPSAGMVYKLVAVADSASPLAPLRPVAKKAAGKGSVGGRKIAYRELYPTGHIFQERIVVRPTQSLTEHLPGRRLQHRLLGPADGRPQYVPNLVQDRLFHAQVMQELVPIDRTATHGQPVTEATL